MIFNPTIASAGCYIYPDADVNCGSTDPWSETQIGVTASSSISANGFTIVARASSTNNANYAGINNNGDMTFKVTADGAITGTRYLCVV